jgi:2-polyprenyl-3-methyl-5-hydroxy-6-metoxy-1,4-benzoquinol methylase
MDPMRERIEAVYTHLWSTHEREPYTHLDASLHPRPHAMLYDVVAALGITASWTVLDVGSGRGNHTCELTRRFGCQVVGVDLAEIHIEQGRTRAAEEGVADRVSFQQGAIEALPFADAMFDLIWSRDMLLHVRRRAFRLGSRFASARRWAANSWNMWRSTKGEPRANCCGLPG